MEPMFRARHVAALLIAAFLAAAATEATAAEPHGRAYLFRGLIGMIDWGMDELAGRINRTGVQANIDSHLSWRSIAATRSRSPQSAIPSAAMPPWILPNVSRRPMFR
jgi:hypothetical protein